MTTPTTADDPRTATLRSLIRADLRANAGNAKGCVVVVSFRLAHAARGTGRIRPWAVPVIALYRLVIDWILGVEIPPLVEAGPGLSVWHGNGLVLHAGTRLGADVTLRHNTTIGALEDGPDGAAPRLGDRVQVGTGAIVLGPYVIGDDAIIGAGAVVLADVPAGATVVGNPGRVLP